MLMVVGIISISSVLDINNGICFVFGSLITSMSHGQKFTITLPFALQIYKVIRGGQFSVDIADIESVTLYSATTTNFVIQYCSQYGRAYVMNYQYLVIGY